MLLKLNHSALNIPVGDDNRPLRFWLDQAKRCLKTVLCNDKDFANAREKKR
jgi:hypothetical protein